MYGTVEMSQVLLICVLAMVRTPTPLASRQFSVARGPGPMTEIEYSPISVLIPPRSIGVLHSLTLWRRVSVGSLGIRLRHIWRGQPQSQLTTSAVLLDRRTPARTVSITSPTTSPSAH